MISFSIVIPLYNKENSISKTINSVLAQSYENYELLIVNDGSKDRSLDVVKSYVDPRIRIIDKSNGGVSSARNRGIEQSKNEWIAFLDGDDLWETNHLENLATLIEENLGYYVFCSSFIKSNEIKPITQDNSIEIIEDYFKKAIIKHFFWTSVTVINKKVFNHVGTFKENITMGEDLDLWARIGKYYKFVQSKLITGIYVQDSENKLSYTKLNIDKTIFNHIELSSKSGTELAYFKRLIWNKIKFSVLKNDWRTIIHLINRYKIKLF